MRNRRAEVSKVTWKLTAFGSIQRGWGGGGGVCLVGHNQIDTALVALATADLGGGGGAQQLRILVHQLPVYLGAESSLMGID